MLVTANGLFPLTRNHNRASVSLVIVGGTIGTTVLSLVLLDENDFQVTVRTPLNNAAYLTDKGMGKTLYLLVSALSGNVSLTVEATPM